MPVSNKQISDSAPAFTAAIETKPVELVVGDASKVTAIGTNLDPKYESALVEFLHENRDIFAWQPADMKGVPRELAEHSLNIDPKCKPVKQPLRRFGDEKRRAIGKEIARLLKASFIREVLHTQWVANPVLVPKKGTK